MSVKRILALLAALGFALCAARASARTLTVASATAMSGNFFGEAFAGTTADVDAQRLLHGYDLVQWQSATGAYGVNRSVVSGVAVTDDGEGNRTYLLTIYDDLLYSNGKPVTAKDYAFSLLLRYSPAMAEIGARVPDAGVLVGGKAYAAGRTRVLSGVRILSDTALSVTVSAAYRPFFHELALLSVHPYPIGVIAPGLEIVDEGEGATIRSAIVGDSGRTLTGALLRSTLLDPERGYVYRPSVVSGPYVLDSYDAQTHTAAFSINPHYKGDARGRSPSIERLVYTCLPPAEMAGALERGEVDLLHKCVSADAIEDGLALMDAGTCLASSYPRGGLSFVSFCCERPAMGSVAVRQAIAHCLDREALASAYAGGFGVVVDGYYGVGQWPYRLAGGAGASLDGVAIYALDAGEAARLLEADGWTLDRDGGAYDAADGVRCKRVDGELVALDLTLRYPEGNEIAGALQSAFLEPLAQAGVRVTPVATPMDRLVEMYERRTARDCDMIYLAANLDEGADLSAAFAPGGDMNPTAIADETLYALAVRLRETEPGDTRAYRENWAAFQARFSQVLPAVPVYSNTYFDFYTAGLQGYEIAASPSWADAIVGARLTEE